MENNKIIGWAGDSEICDFVYCGLNQEIGETRMSYGMVVLKKECIGVFSESRITSFNLKKEITKTSDNSEKVIPSYKHNCIFLITGSVEKFYEEKENFISNLKEYLKVEKSLNYDKIFKNVVRLAEHFLMGTLNSVRLSMSFFKDESPCEYACTVDATKSGDPEIKSYFSGCCHCYGSKTICDKFSDNSDVVNSSDNEFHFKAAERIKEIIQFGQSQFIDKSMVGGPIQGYILHKDGTIIDCSEQLNT